MTSDVDDQKQAATADQIIDDFLNETDPLPDFVFQDEVLPEWIIQANREGFEEDYERLMENLREVELEKMLLREMRRNESRRVREQAMALAENMPYKSIMAEN